MEKMVDGTALKPVRCGCGGEAKVDWVLEPSNCYMACVYCNKCGTKTIPFWSEDKDKAIDYAVTTWNRAMGERTAKVRDLERRSETSMSWEGKCSNCGAYTNHEMNYCFECGCRLIWGDD